MVRILLAIFFVLHGLVHLLYAGQSQRLFELQTGLLWPDGAWAFSRVLGDGPIKTLATLCCVVAALGFVAGGAGLLFKQAWWHPLVVGSALFSILLFVLFWNGSMQRLDQQGAVALLINVAILSAVLLFRWPRLTF